MIRWFALAAVGFFASPVALGQTCTHTWVGGDGHFNDDASWDVGLAPGASDTACITAPGTYTVSLSDVRSGAERDRFGAGRTLSRLVLGGESGTQTLRMTESAFESEGYEELGVDELTIRETGRFEMPGGTLLNGTLVHNVGSWVLGGGSSPQLLGVEVVNVGSLTIATGTTHLQGRLVNEDSGELRWMGTGAILDMERNDGFVNEPEVVNRGLLVSNGEANALEGRRGRFVNDGGRVQVDSGELALRPGHVSLKEGEYNAALAARLSLGNSFDIVELEGRIQGEPEGEVVFESVEFQDAEGTAVLHFGGAGVRLDRVSGVLRNEGVIREMRSVGLGARLTNTGRILVSGVRVFMYGTWLNESEGTLALNAGDRQAQVLMLESGQFINRGRVVAESGTRNQVLGAFTNEDGRLEASGGDLTVSGAPMRLVQGTYAASAGRTLRLGASTLAAAGILRGEGDGTWILGFNSTVRQSLNETGVFDFGGPGLIVETGEFSGRWINLGRMIQRGGGYRQGTFENRGTLEWQGPVILREAILKNEADATLLIGVDGTVEQSGSLLTNRGLIVKSGGEGITTLEPVVVNTESGDIRASSGTLAFRTLTDVPGARYSGTGTLALPANTVISGTIAPGDSASSTGILTWAGPLLTSSSFALDVDLNGLAPGSGHDQLVVQGDLNLAGTLRGHVGSGFSPEVGTFFEVLRAEALLGGFESYTLASGLATGTAASSVRVVVLGPVSSESPEDGILEAELAILGNPSRQPVLRLTVPKKSAVNAEILDVRGRKVAQSFGPMLPRGVHEAPVPRLPAGVYLVRASVESKTFVQLLTVVE